MAMFLQPAREKNSKSYKKVIVDPKKKALIAYFSLMSLINPHNFLSFVKNIEFQNV